MFITNQFYLPVTLNDVAATNDTNAVTGIAVGGPFNGAITAMTNAATATPIATGDGVTPVPTTQATFIPFSTTCNYYRIDLNGVVVVAGRPHVLKLTHFNLHISDYEYVLDYRVTTLETDVTRDSVAATITAVCNYVRAQKAFFITIPDAAIANLTNTKNLILLVVFGRQN